MRTRCRENEDALTDSTNLGPHTSTWCGQWDPASLASTIPHAFQVGVRPLFWLSSFRYGGRFRYARLSVVYLFCSTSIFCMCQHNMQTELHVVRLLILQKIKRGRGSIHVVLPKGFASKKLKMKDKMRGMICDKKNKRAKQCCLLH